MSSDRLPPQNIEAEEAILGGILLDPEAVSRVTELLRPEFFAIEAHQILYKAMWQLYNQGKPTDLMTVTSWLTDNNQLEKIGGQVKIVQLLERTVSAVNIDQYAALVIDKYIRRKLIQAGNEIFDLGFQTATELKTILDQAEQKIFALTQDKPQQDLVPISETLINTFQEIEDRNEGIALPGLACGFYDLDAMTGGFQRSDLIIVAGRPSMGKCAAYDTLVLQKDGSLITLAEVYQRQETELLTLGKNWKFQITKPSAFIDDGIKPVFRVTTKSGRFVETTITHPFLTVDGWKPLAKLQVGEKIAVPRRLDIFGNETIPENQFASLIDSDNFCLSPIVFKLEKSQLALFIRYLFSLDGWVKILESREVCFGYSVASEKFVRQVQHLLLRFEIIGAIEKVEEGKSRKGKTNKNLWHLTITDTLSVKKLVADIGNFPSINLDLSSSTLNLVRQENFWVEKLENTQIFWDKVLVVMEKFAESRWFSPQRRNGTRQRDKNFRHLTTCESLSVKSGEANISSSLLEDLDLLTKENSWVEKLKDWEIFGNEIVCVMEKFAESRWFSPQRRNGTRQRDKNFRHLTTCESLSVKSGEANISSSLLEDLDLLTKENSWVEKLKDWEIFGNEIVCVMEKFAESRWFSPQRRNGTRQRDKNFRHLTTCESLSVKSGEANISSSLLEDLDLLTKENSWVEKLKDWEIFGNEIVCVMEKFAESRWFSPQRRNGTRQRDKNFRHLTTCESLSVKSGATNIGSSLSEDLDFDSDRFDLAKPDNAWREKLENREFFWDELVSLVEKFAESKNQSLQSRSGKITSPKNSENLTITDTICGRNFLADADTIYGKNLLTDIRNLPSENLDFNSDRFDLAKPDNAWREKLENREFFWDELVSLVEKFAESKNQSLQSRTVKRKSDKNADNLTTTDTICGENILTDIRNLPSENLDFNSDRFNLTKPDNAWREQLESREFFWDELVSLMEKFAESKNQSLQSRTVKGKSHKNSDNLTTADALYKKNILADIENFPSENLDFDFEKLNLVRPENSWSEQLENRDIFWNELVNLIENFAESQKQSVKSRTVKGKSEKNVNNLTITNALYRKNILTDIRNLSSENLFFHSERFNLVRPENSGSEQLENRDIFWNELVNLIENFAESQKQSVKSRTIKGKSPKNSENLTTTDTICGENILTDIRNLSSENLFFHSDRFNLVRPENSGSEQLENRDIFWNELVNLIENFAESQKQSVKSRTIKGKSPKNSENLTTTDTICGENILTDIGNVPSENLFFYSERFNLVRPENSGSEQLENRDIFWNELVNLIENFAESQKQSVKSRTVKGKSEKNVNNLTITNALYRKNILTDIRNLSSENLFFHSERFNLVRPENSGSEQLENRDIFWNELVNLIENFAESQKQSVKSRTIKGKSPKNSENLTTTDTICGENILTDIRNLSSENLFFHSERFNLVRPENSGSEQLENRDIFWNELVNLIENFAESQKQSVKSRTIKGKSPKNSENLTTTDTICGENILTDIRNLSSENLFFHSERFNLVRPENSGSEQLENRDIFWNELVNLIENFAESQKQSVKSRTVKGKSEKNVNNLTITNALYRKNILTDIRNLSSENLFFHSERFNLVRPENSGSEQLENRDIFWNELVNLIENFAESQKQSVKSRTIKGKSPKNSENLTTTDTICGENILTDIRNLSSENLFFHSERFNLVRPENSGSEQLENRDIFWNELVNLIENFAESQKQSVKSRTIKGKSPKNSENLTTTDTICGENILTDIRNLSSENLFFHSERFNLVRPENSGSEQLENRDIFWNKLVNLIENFAESKNQLVKSITVKEKYPKNSENLTTTDTICGENILTDIGNVPSENQDFDSERFNLVRPENSWSEQLENTEIFWDKLISLVANFVLSKNWSAKSRSGKKTSPKNSDNLTTTDTICGKNILANMENLPSENLGLHSHRLNLAKPENSWSEKLENREFFWNKFVCLMVKIAESQNQSVKNRTVKGKSPKNSDNLTTTDTICGKNILANMGNLPSENLDFDSEKSNLAKPDNFWSEQLENDDIYWDEIVSITAVGEKQVYDLTVPETHNFVANDICLHNTSFAVNIGHSIAANLKLPVAIFSLEMSKEQLVLRLLASEARIESNRLRSGRISQSEWEPLTSAIGTLAEMPIFIDDTPNITVNEIRSKVRQLQSEQGGALGLILLDYLQLMEGSNTDNRVLELARITRSLKGLARELSVPIIALSQLSRSVESRTNKRPMMSDLRESGCLTGDTLICLADGKKIPISRLVGKSNFSVLALNENTGKFESAIVSKVFYTGVKPIFSLQTSSGKLIRATANHPFFSMGGWKQLNTLNIGDSLAILNQKMLKYSILYCRQLLSQVEFGPKYGGNLGSVVKCREWEKPTQIDVNWDEIVEIRPDGEAEVFDLTVPGLHNFVANEIVVHNSIEQDADLVIMLYRDEYYSPDTPDQGIAEVIITKHRNGPTGTVKLLFDPQFTKFRNLAIRGGNREQGTGNR